MRTVIVTGATSGFGRSLVREFLNNGDRVVATGRRLSQRKELLAEERERWPNRLIERDLDVTDATERSKLEEFCRVELGGHVDILVNNAGYGLFGALEDLGEDELRAQFDVNFFGLAFVTRDLLPFLRASKGMIFNLSSVLGFMGFPLTGAYCASKFAVEGLTESLFHELKSHGVRVCLIEPGSYQTGFGSGSAWAAKSGPPSAFAAQDLKYKKMRTALGGGRPVNPDVDEVPRGILKLSNKRCLPLRARFGKDSRGTFLGRKLLPSGLFLKILGTYFSRKIG